MPYIWRAAARPAAHPVGDHAEQRHAEALEPDQELARLRHGFALRSRHQHEARLRAAQQAAKRMRDGGRIINIISVAAHHASPGFGAYSAANNAVISMTRTMAVELAPRGITVNCIAPGIVVTDMFVETMGMTWEQAEEFAAKQVPLGRTGYPEDIGAAAVFLASPAAAWTTGQFIDVAGGPS